MKLVRHLKAISVKGCVVTIGNFDGLHVGHRALIERTIERAQQLSVPSVVMSFHPLPYEYFNPHEHHQIMPFSQKFKGLENLGVDYFFNVPFNQAFASLPPERFVNEYLVQGLQARHIILGADARFGHQKKGDVPLLTQLGERYGFQVETLPDILNQSAKVSSSKIRQALIAGDITRANQLLGYPFTLSARVQLGKQKGRELGFPTANLGLHSKYLSLNGVYICWAKVNGRTYPAVTNIGYQPTLHGRKKRVEVHLLDFSGDLYGQKLQVSFLEKIRNEKKFNSFSELIERIKHDILIAQAYFSSSEVGKSTPSHMLSV